MLYVHREYAAKEAEVLQGAADFMLRGPTAWYELHATHTMKFIAMNLIRCLAGEVHGETLNA